MNDPEAYLVKLDGDGRVPHELGKLPGVPNYYVESSHGDLASNGQILDALTTCWPMARASYLRRRPNPEVREVSSWQSKHVVANWRMRRRSSRICSAGCNHAIVPCYRDRSKSILSARQTSLVDAAGVPLGPNPVAKISPDEQALESILAGGFLGVAGTMPAGPQTPAPVLKIDLRIVCGGIEEAGTAGDLPIDVIAVGHYLGVKPQDAERAIDKAISRAMLALEPQADIDDEKLLLTQFTNRGAITRARRSDLFSPRSARQRPLDRRCHDGLSGRFRQAGTGRARA